MFLWLLAPVIYVETHNELYLSTVLPVGGRAWVNEWYVRWRIVCRAYCSMYSNSSRGVGVKWLLPPLLTKMRSSPCYPTTNLIADILLSHTLRTVFSRGLWWKNFFQCVLKCEPTVMAAIVLVNSLSLAKYREVYGYLLGVLVEMW